MFSVKSPAVQEDDGVLDENENDEQILREWKENTLVSMNVIITAETETQTVIEAKVRMV